MSRFLLGVGLLLALLGIGLYAAYVTEDVHAPIAQALETAAQEALAGNLEAGTQWLAQASSQWQTHRNTVAAALDHEPMDEIDSLFAQAEAYARGGQATDFAAFCLRLVESIHAATQEHMPSWWNLL